MKYSDTEIDTMTLGYETDATLLMNGIGTGTGVQERIGRKILVRGIQLGIILDTPTTTGVSQAVRIVVVQDKQANGTACGWDDVFDDGTSGNNASTLTDPLNVENRFRFNILFDKIVNLQVQSAAPQNKTLKVYRKVTIPVIYGGNGDEIDDINTNSIYLLVKNSVAAGTSSATIGGYTRIRYTDM